MSLPEKVLIANRGEIAVADHPHAARARDRKRRRLTTRSTATAWRCARPTRRSSCSATPPVAAYLDGEAIIAAAQAHRAPTRSIPASASSPRTPTSPRRSPTPGSPSSARRRTRSGRWATRSSPSALAAAAGVPTLPGSDGALADAEEALAEAERIGYPVLLKASAGGGGKGMRIAARHRRMPRGLHPRLAGGAAQRSATGASSSSATSSARATSRSRCSPTRHGNVVHLGERECSIQRRYQKVIEEAPSPLIDAADPRRRWANGRSRSREPSTTSRPEPSRWSPTRERNFYFLEMNTRLQVEHPVTELVTGLDIVAEQLRIAGGEPLGSDPGRHSTHRARDRVPGLRRGHRSRLHPRHRTAAPRPLPGRATASGSTTASREGQPVTAAFDPMIAKVIGYGETAPRRDRRTRSRRCATPCCSGRIPTPSSSSVCWPHPDFAAGDTHTAFLDEHPELLRHADQRDGREQRTADRRRGAGQPALRSALRPAGAARLDSASWRP